MTVPVERRHVLVVAIDGVRADERRAATTPALDAIEQTGFLTDVRVDERNPTISGPVWATVASGVYGAEHGIRDNDLRGNRLDEFPDVLTRVRQEVPGATTFAAASWPQLVSSDHGGPIFAGGGFLPNNPAGQGEQPEAIAVMDAEATVRTCDELRTADHAVLFSYIMLPDAVGHAEGVTPRYRSAIEWSDGQLARMLTAIDERLSRTEEEWTVIVVTDHGHLDEGHHGGESEEERSAWIAASGPGITADSGTRVDHADIPVHILRRFDIPIDPAWGLAGVDFGGR